MVKSSVDLLLFNCGAGLIFETYSSVKHCSARIEKPCDHVSDTSNNGHVVTRWDDRRIPQHVYAIISFLRTPLKWFRNKFWDQVLPHEVSCLNGYKNFPPVSCPCLLAFGIRLWPVWLLIQYLSPGPPRKHCSHVLKLDTISIGFSFCWLGLAEWNSLTRHCEPCWSRCY